MSGYAWAWVTTAVLIAMVANLFVWLHWSDSIWWKTTRDPKKDTTWRQHRDEALRKHISWSVLVSLWPLALPLLALAGIRWLYRWLRFAAGGAYPG